MNGYRIENEMDPEKWTCAIFIRFRAVTIPAGQSYRDGAERGTAHSWF
jgi:hypothetical protein